MWPMHSLLIHSLNEWSDADTVNFQILIVDCDDYKIKGEGGHDVGKQ